jgi:glycosyltransferase involved in cell wall biosynthesis
VNHIQLSQISIIVPVKDNSKGVHRLLHSFFNTQKPGHFPLEIIIVDNRSNLEIILDESLLNKGITIRLIKCDKKGPAAARNEGVKIAKGSWIFFTDSDCIFTESSLLGYTSSVNGGVAYAGNITPLKSNVLCDDYSKMNLLNPPVSTHKKKQPAYMVTANCLIHKTEFERVGGFNENFELAGGEDVDLGIRLSKLLELHYAPRSIIKHNFENSLRDFYKRFYRYGFSSRQLEKIHHISINVEQFLPGKQSGISCLLTQLLRFAFNKGKNDNI